MYLNWYVPLTIQYHSPVTFLRVGVMCFVIVNIGFIIRCYFDVDIAEAHYATYTYLYTLNVLIQKERHFAVMSPQLYVCMDVKLVVRAIYTWGGFLYTKNENGEKIRPLKLNEWDSNIKGHYCVQNEHVKLDKL